MVISVFILQREGWLVNHKRVYRIYCEEGLNLRAKRPKRRRSAAQRVQRSPTTFSNEIWSMDFVTNSLFNFEVGQHIRGEDVVVVVERIKAANGRPCFIRLDNGPKFIPKELDKWAYDNRVTLDFSRPGKPIDNAYVELFNGSFRDKRLNTN
jgi:putative transposase